MAQPCTATTHTQVKDENCNFLEFRMMPGNTCKRHTLQAISKLSDSPAWIKTTASQAGRLAGSNAKSKWLKKESAISKPLWKFYFIAF